MKISLKYRLYYSKFIHNFSQIIHKSSKIYPCKKFLLVQVVNFSAARITEFMIIN